MSLTQKLDSLKIVVPQLSGPFGAYVPARRDGSLIYVAGQLPIHEGKLLAAGRVPSTCSLQQAQLGARQCVINALAAARSVESDLDQLTGVLRVGIFVCSDPDFHDQSKVGNAASELLLDLFGDAGKHARASVGVNALPMNTAVEIEFLFQTR